MGDRFERRNPLVDAAVDVDAAVVPAPPPSPPPPDDPALDEDVGTADDPMGDGVASDEAAGGTEPDEPEEELEEPDPRFGRRNPLIDRTIDER